MRRLSALTLLLFVCGGCGPVLEAFGIAAALDSTPQDLGEPAVELEIRDAEGLARTPPAFSRTPLVFLPKVSKPGVALSALIVGPIPNGADAAERIAIERDYCEDGTVRAGGTLPLREVRDLATDPTKNADLNAILAGLPDGQFTLHLRAVDAKGRTDCASHTWVYDTLPPTAPRLAAVEALAPRSLRVSWTISVDLPGVANGVASGVTGYNIYFDVGQATVPDAPRDANPQFDGKARFSVLEGGTGDSPVFVPGSNVGSLTLTGLFSVRMHYLRVTAVDRAGNETDLLAAEEIASRTRSGGDGTFAPAVSVPAGTQPGPIVTGDFDRDGHLDVVVVDRGAAATRVLFGAGDGTFSTTTLSSGGPGVRSAAVADMNGDHVLDLFLGDAVLIGTRLRADPFVGALGLVADTDPARFCAVGDAFNDDGVPDIVCVGARRIDGSFGARTGSGTYTLDGIGGLGIRELPSNARCVRLVDVDGDRTLDVIVCVEGAIAIPENSVFGPASGYSSGGAPHDLTSADVNGDGIPDLAVSNGNGSVAILIGVGDRSFLPPRLIQLGSGPGRLATGDFDGNGTLDLAVAGSIPQTVALLLGDGAGNFARGRSFPVSGTPAGLVAGDWNEDLVLDLAVSVEEGTVQFLLGNGATGTPDLTFQEVISEPGPVLSVAAGDFDGDGVPDLAASRGTNGVDVFLSRSENGQGRGGFLSRVNFGVLKEDTIGRPKEANIDAVVVVDLDDDGILDLVGQGDATDPDIPFNNVLPLLMGNGAGGRGNGTFRPDRTSPRIDVGPSPDVGVACEPQFPGAVLAPVVADFNGSGPPEVMAVIRRFVGGDFVIANAQRQYFGECAAWDGFAAADVDDDGRIDLVATQGSFDVVNVLRGLGNGQFSGDIPAPNGVPYVPSSDGFAAGDKPAHVIVRDFERDGISDVAVINRGTMQVSILRGDALLFVVPFFNSPGSAAGTFLTRTAYTFASEPTQMAAADLNRDGIPDLVVLQESDRRVSFLLSDATTRTHAVSAGFVVPGAGALSGVAVADFTSDGILDIALGGDAIRVFAGRGTVSGD